MRISDWSSDVCSSDLGSSTGSSQVKTREIPPIQAPKTPAKAKARKPNRQDPSNTRPTKRPQCQNTRTSPTKARHAASVSLPNQQCQTTARQPDPAPLRPEEHTYEHTSLQHNPHTVLVWKKKIE